MECRKITCLYSKYIFCPFYGFWVRRMIDFMQVCLIPWSITHNVGELSGILNDLRGTCLTSRLMALSLPGPETLDAGIISRRWRNIERSSLDGSGICAKNYDLAEGWKCSYICFGECFDSPGSMASSFPLISLFMPSVRASNITCSRWQAARDTVEAPDPITAHSWSIPNSFTIAMVWE